MKVWKMVAALGILGIMGAMVMAADDKPVRERPLRGKIVSVDADAKTLVVQTRTREGEGEKVTVTTDDKTTITLDKKEAKLADLKADMFVAVSPKKGTATKIVAMTKRPERRPRKPE